MLRKLGLVGRSPILLCIEEQQLECLAVVGSLFEVILPEELGLVAVFDGHRLSQFQRLVCAVSTVSVVIAVLEAVCVLGCFGEEEDWVGRGVLVNLPKLMGY